MHSWALASLVFRLASQLKHKSNGVQRLLHDTGEALRVGHGAIVVSETLAHPNSGRDGTARPKRTCH